MTDRLGLRNKSIHSGALKWSFERSFSVLIVSNLVISTLGFNFYSGCPGSLTLVKYGNFIMEASRKVGLVVMQRVFRGLSSSLQVTSAC